MTSLTNKSALTNSNCCDLFAAVIGKKTDKGAAVHAIRREEGLLRRMKNSKEKKKTQSFLAITVFFGRHGWQQVRNEYSTNVISELHTH